MATRQEIIDGAIRTSKLNGRALTQHALNNILASSGPAGEFKAELNKEPIKDALEKQLRDEVNKELAKNGEFPLSNEESEKALERLPQLLDEDGVKEFWFDKFLDALKDLSDLLRPSNPDWDKDYDGIPDGMDIDPNSNHWYRTGLNWIPRRDPLTLDLDGNGIQTLAANGQVLFDQNADGVKEGTGWIAPNDGILVLDRNGNGTIDSGRELFGDNTIKSNGQLAKDGFDALSDLDSNADGKIDSTDVQWSQLKIWKDANSDGISQAGELFSLDTVNGAGIKQINLTNTVSNASVGNGNVATANGTFVWSDGHVGAAESLASNLNLASNPFYREFTDSIAIPEDNLDLANMQGSGAVRDLREAATQSSTLETTLRQYMAATTRDEQMALLDQLLGDWANSNTLMQDWVNRLDAQEIETSFGDRDVDFEVHYKGAANGSGDLVINGVDVYWDDKAGAYLAWKRYDGSDLVVGRFADDAKLQALAKLRVLEIFNHQEFFNFSFAAKDTNNDGITDGFNDSVKVGSVTYSLADSYTSSGGAGSLMPGPLVIHNEMLTMQQGQLDALNQSYELLRQSVYQGLLLQTRLKPYLDQIELAFDETQGFVLDFSAMNELFESHKQTDPKNAIYDLVDTYRTVGQQLNAQGWSSGLLFDSWVNQLSGSAEVQSALNVLKTGITANDDLLLGDASTNSISAGNGDDIALGGLGNDTLSGDAGNDLLIGQADNDYLYGGDGNDILDGGIGNDYLNGGVGNDTYIFSRGSGLDTINTSDTGAGRIDIIKFTDVNLVDITALKLSGSDLQIQYGTGDQITVQNFYSSAAYQITQIQFADGTAYTPTQLFAVKPFQYGSSADTIGMSDVAEIVLMGDGNDSLSAYGGNDQLFGEGGNDFLYGGDGSDTLEGGVGNDYLNGGVGNDTYIFSRGSGLDTINTSDTGAGRIDIIKFTDVNLVDITALKLSGSDLQIQYGTGDQITVQNFYSSAAYQITQIQFADGTAYTPTQLFAVKPFQYGSAADTIGMSDVAEIVRMGDGNDSLSAYGGNDQLFGEGGNDFLYGGDGNDTLEGGVGNDYLNGGVGNDTYIFSRGSGLDTINTSDTGTGRIDIIKFTDVNLVDITALKLSGSDLQIQYGTGDQITVQNFYSSAAYQITQIQFADGTSCTPTQLFMAKPFQYGDGIDNIGLSNASEAARMGGGNDSLNAYGGDDQLFGEAGDDNLYGGDGYDILDGGIGNDYLNGGVGNDTYIFSRGSGLDTINTSDTGAGRIDIIKFTDVNLVDITALKLSGSDLQIQYGTGDQITVQNFYSSAAYQITQIQFADGTAYTPAQLFAVKPFQYGSTADTIGMSDAAEIVRMGDGNDSLSAFGGNDQLFGEGGNDYLYGGDGGDILDGGIGNDYLNGGAGNDTYIFSKNSGLDTINTSDTGTGRIDIIKFADVNLVDITALKLSGSDLQIQYGTGDQITVQNFYSSAAYQITQIQFADGTAYTPTQLFAVKPFQYGSTADTIGMSDAAEIVRMGDGNDSLSAYGGNDQLFGEGGNDYLYGGGGNDILDGGVGNDYLNGGAGSDIYKFGRGFGVDSVNDSDATVNTDQLQFGTDVAVDQLWFRHVGNNLEVSIVGTTDSVTITNWYSSSAYHTEQFKTADGKLLLDSQVENLVSAMAAFSPPSAGQTTLPQNYQDSLNTVIAANWH